MPSEWLPIPMIRCRLWLDAKVNHFDMKIALPLRHRIDALVTTHTNNYYDGKLPTNSEGVQIMEWPPMRGFASRLHLNIWPAQLAEAAARDDTNQTQPQKPGPKADTSKRIQAAMLDDVKSGRLTKDALENMLEKQLEARYGGSRDTCRKARIAALATLDH